MSNFKRVIPKFNPENHGLSHDFLLTSYASLKGWCSKVPQNKLEGYLKNIGDGTIGKETPDCSVIQLKGGYS